MQELVYSAQNSLAKWIICELLTLVNGGPRLKCGDCLAEFVLSSFLLLTVSAEHKDENTSTPRGMVRAANYVEVQPSCC